MNSNFKRIICLLLCLCMTVGTFFVLTSCGGDDVEDTGNTDESNSDDQGGDNAEGKVTVVRAITLVERGKALSKLQLEEVEVDAAAVPEGAVTSIRDVQGKFANVVLYPGDYIFEDKVQAKKDDSMQNGSDKYAVLTDFCINKGDISGDLQKYINENPNTTVYIPDGIYQLSKPVNIPSTAGKSVSIRMSYRAVLQPDPVKWEAKDDALLHIGSDKEQPAAAGKSEDTCTITGGIIETSARATGIIVEGAGNVVIANMSIKSAEMGIHIKTNNVDVDNVVVTGTESEKSTAVMVEGSFNTVSNMRMYKVNTGVHLTAGNNVLRNLHPLLSPTQADLTRCMETYGFYDVSEGNYYDYCYSDQLSIGFWLGDGNASILNGCFAYWYKDSQRHWGAYAAGKFDSVIRNCRFDLCNSSETEMNPDSAYLNVENGFEGSSKGMIIAPIATNSTYGERCDRALFTK